MLKISMPYRSIDVSILVLRGRVWGMLDENGNSSPRNPFANSIMGYKDKRDINFQAIMLLSEMKSMVIYRRSQEGERTVEEESNNNVDISRLLEHELRKSCFPSDIMIMGAYCIVSVNMPRGCSVQASLLIVN